MERRVTKNLDPSPQLDTMTKTFSPPSSYSKQIQLQDIKEKCLHYLSTFDFRHTDPNARMVSKQFFFHTSQDHNFMS